MGCMFAIVKEHRMFSVHYIFCVPARIFMNDLCLLPHLLFASIYSFFHGQRFGNYVSHRHDMEPHQLYKRFGTVANYIEKKRTAERQGCEIRVPKDGVGKTIKFQGRH